MYGPVCDIGGFLAFADGATTKQKYLIYWEKL